MFCKVSGSLDTRSTMCYVLVLRMFSWGMQHVFPGTCSGYIVPKTLYLNNMLYKGKKERKEKYQYRTRKLKLKKARRL